MKKYRLLMLCFILLPCYAENIASYGSWISPISEANVVEDAVSFESMKIDPAFPENVYWSALDPAEHGRSLIMKYQAGKTQACLRQQYSAHSQANSYGGGEFTVDHNKIYFSNEKDNRLYVSENCGAEPAPITPPGNFRYADCVVDSSHQALYCVREEVIKDQRSVNTLIRMSLLNHDVRVISQGHDFYSSPALSPDGKKIAWITWDFPNMAWDSSQLWMAEIQNNGDLTHVQSIVDKKNVAVFQPQWSPGGDLYVVTDVTGWWNLYRFDQNKLTNIYPASAEFGVAAFNFGFSTYSFVNDHLIAVNYVEQGRGHAGLLDTRTQKLAELPLPYTEFAQIRSNPEAIYFFGVTAQTPPAVIQYTLKDKKASTLQWSRHLTIKPDYLSTPQLIQYKTASNQISYGNYYPPKNPDYRAPKGEKPPLIVIVHGGPTNRAYWALDLEKQYWTSRGYALLDLNYPGSIGYGRAYRNALNGKWGIADRDAAIAGALYLVKKGLVNPKRLIIKGGSAGGYTVLRTLTTSQVFQVGTDYYGWTDLEAVYKNTHKLEAHYLDSLIGPYPQRRALYRARSPLFAADKISGALLIFQGLQDPVVLPSQSEMMYQAVKKHGTPVSYISFPDESHGFRKSTTLIRSLQTERDFYQRILGINQYQ